MNTTERNYEIYDKELLAIMTSLDEFRHHLMGARHVFEIWTDHKNLEYFRKPQKLNRRQARWVSELANYHYTLHHKPGKTHTKPDLLSRRADHDRGDRDNEDVVVLKPEVFRELAFDLQAMSFDLQDEADTLLARIRSSRGNMDRSVQKALRNQEAGWTDDGKGIVTWRDRVYVPRDKGLRGKIIRLNHDTPSAGHPGRYKTQELITRNYWWPGIQADVRRYIDGCEACQRTKAHHNKPAAPLHPHEIPSRNWEVISVDMVGPLPDSLGQNALLNVICTRSKQLISIPTDSELSAEGWARLFIQHVYRRTGLPRKIISDRGPQFVSKFIEALYRLLGIQGNPSTAYHPQTDGQTERVNQEVEQYLRLFVNHRQSDWAEWIPIAEFSYNNRVHSSTGYSPFFLNYGFHPSAGTGHRVEVRNESAQQFVDRLTKAREDADAALKFSQSQMKLYYDRKRTASRPYKAGDLVWLEGTNIKTDRPAKKLEDRRYGPFKILKQIGASAFKLHIPRKWRGIHPVVNEALLTPYTPPAYPDQRATRPPVPDVLEPTEDWVVEEVVDCREEKKPGTYSYLVHWKDHPRSERQWVPRSELLQTAPAAISNYHRRFPTNPRPPFLKIPPRIRSSTLTEPFVYAERLLRPPGVLPQLYNWSTGSFDDVELEQSRGRDSWRGGNVRGKEHVDVCQSLELD